MKKLSFVALAVMLVACCTPKTEQTAHPAWAYNATIYELNTRQLTPEGTFAAATERLPELKKIGVDIIWVMPLQPIGILERKGTLGSYYAIRDYCNFNPEFGTRADFEAFLAKAHELGMKVILDWVANHTSPDHAWTQNEDWHMRDSLGNLTIAYDWTDIAELNYDNDDMRQAMKQSMRWWIDSIGIDGFRCDVAFEVPTDFWEDIFSEIRAYKPDLFTLAEAELAELNVSAFDMYYGWELHGLMNKVAKGEADINALWDCFAKADTTFVPKAIRMNFTSNHDENSWNGTEFERLGAGSDAFAAFTYVVPGMPLIYTGQEYGMDKRLSFFEKDSVIVNENASQFTLYQKLNALRKNNSALWSQEKGGDFTRLPIGDAENVFACARQTENNTVLACFNFSNEPTTFVAKLGDLAGEYTQFDGKTTTLEAEETIELKAWGWQIWTK